MKRSVLEAALLRIAERQQLIGVNAADYKMLGVIEGIAHELSHALDLGPDFEESLNAMEDADANEREAATLRIEIAALATLGVYLSTRRLWATANWRNCAVAFDRLAVPPNRHERRCAKRFVDMVKATALEGVA